MLLIGFRAANGGLTVVSAANPLPVTGGGGGGGSTSVTATAAAPTYVEGSTTNPLSVDLAGGLRVTGPLTDTQLRATAVPVSGPITNAQMSALNPATTTLQTALNTLVGAQNAAAWASGDGTLISLLKAIATAAIATAATTVQHVAYTTVRTITPGVNVTAGKALMVNCTTAGTLTIELQGGNTLAVAVAIGPAFFDKLAAIDIAWSGGGAGTAYVLDA